MPSLCPSETFTVEMFLSSGKWHSPMRVPHPSTVFSRLRPLDIEFMKRLSKVVNIVPVIAKADTLTLEERDYFKQRVRGCAGWELSAGRQPGIPRPQR